jgi:methylthioribose-1-phosphate isomerase
VRGKIRIGFFVGEMRVSQPQLLSDELPRAIQWDGQSLYLLDQTLLPAQTVMEEQKTAEQVWTAIKMLKVRGAPAIGVAAAYGLCVAIREDQNLGLSDFKDQIRKQAAYLDSSRPTAVNLGWAMARMVDVAENSKLTTAEGLFERLVCEAETIHAEDIGLCHGMGAHGAPLIREGMGILTHCNAGSLATSELGTATAPMYVAHQAGIAFKVYADETRPLLQGARLTAWELQQAGIDVTLMTDNMAAHMMSKGHIDMVIVGTDRVAANGDVANKIGTLGVAILAQHYGIPFYVACPSSTIDFSAKTGADIPIEERDPSEVTSFGGAIVAPKDIQVANPAFDVTPNALVDGLITEKGIIRAPFEENLRATFGGKS